MSRMRTSAVKFTVSCIQAQIMSGPQRVILCCLHTQDVTEFHLCADE